MPNGEFKITVDDLKGEAERISKLAAQGQTADAIDRVYIAINVVGAGILERLETLQGSLDLIADNRKRRGEGRASTWSALPPSEMTPSKGKPQS